MDFEWDPKKNERNIAWRGIDFIWAAGIFLGPIVEQIVALPLIRIRNSKCGCYRWRYVEVARQPTVNPSCQRVAC